MLDSWEKKVIKIKIKNVKNNRYVSELLVQFVLTEPCDSRFGIPVLKLGHMIKRFINFNLA